MNGHVMTVSWDGGWNPTYALKCTLPDDAICRARWDCDCEYFADHGVNDLGPWHELADDYMTDKDRESAEAGDPPLHYGKPGGKCGVCLWINESDCPDELGGGSTTFPVDVSWGSDEYRWTAAEVTR